MSRCSSPIPLRMVWPLSWSVWTRNDGSSATSFASATPSFSWSAFDFGSIAISITGSGNSIFSRITGLCRIAQRVAGAHFLQAGERDDVARIGFLDVLAVVGVHQQHAADALLAVLGRVDDAGAGGQRARIDAAERDRADERIVHDLEREQRHRLLVVRLAHDLVVLVVDALDRRHVERRRQIIDHRVEQRLHALVLERRAAQHRIERAGDHGLADQRLSVASSGSLPSRQAAMHVVIELDGGLDHLLAVFLGLVEHVGRNVDVVILRAERLLVPDDALHAHEVDRGP